MSYVGKMSDLIELYLAELERDGVEDVLGVGLPVVSGILTDFAQWLEDDVQDTETVDGLSADVILVDDAAGIENWDMPSQEELDELGQYKAAWFLENIKTGFEPGKMAVIQAPLQSVGKSDFAAQLIRSIQEKDVTLRFGECKDEEDSDIG